MKTVRPAPVNSTVAFAAALFAAALAAHAAPPVLRWNGGAGGIWDGTAANWLDSGDNAVAWQSGSEARFEGAGGLVNVAAEVSASNLTFAANGYTLLGAGRLAVEGTVSAAAATTNCVASELFTLSGLTKTGDGALALARCSGPIVVQAGALLASGSLFADAELSVAGGAALVTLGEPDTASNLLLNPGFELPALGSGAWGYVGTGVVISNWTCTALPYSLGRQNTAAATPWNAAGASPEGTHMLIMQYNSAVAQTVSVPAGGLYALSFSHLLRSGYPEHQIYMTLDGLPLAAFLNRSVQFSPGRFASGALWLTAGSHTLTLSGEGGWGDRASMVDAVCLAPPSPANPCRALSGDSLLKAVTGASVVLSHTGTAPLTYLALNGTPASGTFDAAHASGLFSGPGALSCASPGSVFTWSGTGLWSDAARWADGSAPAAGGSASYLVRFPSAAGRAATNDLAGAFLASRLSVAGLPSEAAFALSGNALALTNDAAGAAPKISLAAPGAAAVSAAVTARSSLTLAAAGPLTFTDHPLTLPNGAALTKLGPGTVAMPALTNALGSANIYGGALETPALPSSAAVSLLTLPGQTNTLYLTQGGVTQGNTINLMGSGTPCLATRCGGGTVTLSNWLYGYSDAAFFDVGAGDTLSVRQVLLTYLSGGAKVSATTLTKAGPGTLEIRSGGLDAGNSRAYFGRTVLRNGSLSLSEDDWGTLSGWTNPFNGRTYSGTGGSLGYSSLTNAVALGDSGTGASDDVALIANGDGRWIGRDIEVFNRGANATLGMTTGTVMFAGTITLHRDVTLSGPTNGVIVVSNVVAAADFAGTGAPAFSGLAGLRVEGAFPSAASLLMGGRLLSFGTYAVKAQTLSALSLGSAGSPGALNIDFAPGTNDTIAVSLPGGLMLSNTVVNLYCAGTGLPFAEPGTYSLLTYAGALGGDVALLTVGNPQAGASYAFSNDTASARVLLTIGNTASGTSAIWKRATGGDWGAGANWDSGAVPDAAGVSALFGLAITGPATVALGGDRTVGSLAFNNAAHSYTLSSGSLTFDNGDPTPFLSVFAGSHTLDTTVGGSSGLAVSADPGTRLILGTNAVVNTGLTLVHGTLELKGSAAVNGDTALSAATLLRNDAGAGRVGSLSGAGSAAVELVGAAPKLTISQGLAGDFAGALSGPSGATLEKAGAAALTLSGSAFAYSGRVEVAEGTLALKATPVGGATAVGAAGTLAVQAATNGLTGFYYSVTPNTNAFWTLAGLESHLAPLKPDLISLSGLQNTAFDFGAAGALFPQPYGAGGSRTVNFEAVYRGSINLPESGTYVFGVSCDDGVVLAINGQTLIARNRYVAGWSEAAARFDAGRYDVVIGYFQATSGYGLQVRVKPPSATAASLLPSAWLTPYASVGGLSGSGDVTLAESGAALRVAQSGASGFAGDLSGSSGSLLAKGGGGTLALGAGGANAFAGDVDVQTGTLALAASDLLGDASALQVRAGATLSLAGVDTVGSLAGQGSVSIGGYVYTATFSGDADSDITPAKAYTHLLDFPANGSPATVNGVAFADAGMSGSLPGGYAWAITGMPPVGIWTNAPLSGMELLLFDFAYGSTDFTLNLTGLEPNKTYEARLYFRNFSSNPRHLVFTFSAGASAVGSLSFNPDSVARSWVGCRYTTDSSGTLAVRILSLDGAHTCHLYGLSNEKVSDSGEATLTLAPPSGRTPRFLGALSGNGSLVKAGAGTQHFGGANTLSQPLAVQTGKVLLEPGATVTAGVSVAAGAVLEAPFGGVSLGGLAGPGTFSLGSTPTNGGPYFVSFTNDAGTGISPLKTYTHLLDFGTGGGRAVVNGVAFDKVSGSFGAINGFGWTNAPGSGHPGGNGGNIGVLPSQSISNLLYDMNYNARTTTLQLTGLTIGKRYEIRFYNRRWETAEKNRSQTFIFDPDGPGPVSDPVTFNPDSALVKPNDNYLAYRYLAATNVLSVRIQSATADTYHLYGLSNEETFDTLGSPVTLDIGGTCVFDGAVTGLGAWTKAGAGSLTVAGESTATGPLAVSAGAFGVANGGRATAGPVSVAPGATLFGHGRMGGSVAVASNAWLMAGTASACGMLQVVGDLALAPGARPLFRFAPGSSDAFTVGGRLTFPTNGVLQAEALAPGAMPPAKVPLFTSAQVISGPDTLSGWTVAGASNCSLLYSSDRKTIFFQCPRGILILVR